MAIGWGNTKPPLGTPLNLNHPLTRGMVACWLFNEGMGDQVHDLISGNDGQLTNFAIPRTVISGWNPGDSGAALEFDNDDDFIDIGTKALFGLAAVSVAVKVRTNQVAIEREIVSKADFGYRLMLSAASPYRFQFNTNGSFKNGFSGIGATVGKWHSGVGTFDGIARCYMDGQDGTSQADTALVTTDNQLTIGVRASDTTTNNWHGGIEYVYIYNRALSAVEVMALHIAPYQMFGFDPWAWLSVVVGAPAGIEIFRRRIEGY